MLYSPATFIASFHLASYAFGVEWTDQAPQRDSAMEGRASQTIGLAVPTAHSCMQLATCQSLILGNRSASQKNIAPMARREKADTAAKAKTLPEEDSRPRNPIASSRASDFVRCGPC